MLCPLSSSGWDFTPLAIGSSLALWIQGGNLWAPLVVAAAHARPLKHYQVILSFPWRIRHVCIHIAPPTLHQPNSCLLNPRSLIAFLHFLPSLAPFSATCGCFCWGSSLDSQTTPLLLSRKCMAGLSPLLVGVRFLQYLKKKNFLSLAWEDEWLLFVWSYILEFLTSHFP